MSAIYLTMAVWNYEGSAPIRAFTSKSKAEALAARCREYDATKPPCPEAVDTPENDAEWAAWDPLDAKWRAEHPAGEYTSADRYDVIEIELDTEIT